MASQDGWFRNDEMSGVLSVEFLGNQEEREWEPKILQCSSFRGLNWEGKSVRLSGASAVWVYAAVAAAAVKGGALCISVHNFHEKKDVAVYPVESRTHDGSEAFKVSQKVFEVKKGFVEFEDENRNEEVLLRFVERRFCEDEISLLASEVKCIEESVVTLTGKGPLWMYAAAAAHLASKPRAALLVYSPRASGSRSILVSGGFEEKKENQTAEYTERWGDLVGEMLPASSLLGLNKNGIVLGILGDPNSGKSVFSFLLEKVRKKNKMDGWRFDCDYQAPTPYWYLNLLGTEREAEVKEVREKGKIDWNERMEERAAKVLQHLRASMELVIADMPGGIHKKGERWSLRVPKGREVILRECDYFVIIAREPYSVVCAEWLQALAYHEGRPNLQGQGADLAHLPNNLAHRVIGVIHSKQPDGELALDCRPDFSFFEGIAKGLNRSSLQHQVEEESSSTEETVLRFLHFLPVYREFEKIRSLLVKERILEKAFFFALRSHGTQTRMDERTPYFYHLVRVTAKVAQVTNHKAILAAALLHDLIEDTQASRLGIREVLKQKKGEHIQNEEEVDEVLSYIEALTKTPNIPFEEQREVYFEKIHLGGKGAVWIKMADFQDNLEDVRGLTKERHLQIKARACAFLESLENSEKVSKDWLEEGKVLYEKLKVLCSEGKKKSQNQKN